MAKPLPLDPQWETIRDMRLNGREYNEIAEATGLPSRVVQVEIKKLFRRGILTPTKRRVIADEISERFASVQPDLELLNVKCKFPGCRQLSGYSFALVPLCKDHHNDIHTETRLYYSKSAKVPTYLDRFKYLQIVEQIRWRHKNGGVIW